MEGHSRVPKAQPCGQQFLAGNRIGSNTVTPEGILAPRTRGALTLCPSGDDELNPSSIWCGISQFGLFKVWSPCVCALPRGPPGQPGLAPSGVRKILQTDTCPEADTRCQDSPRRYGLASSVPGADNALAPSERVLRSGGLVLWPLACLRKQALPGVA
ncbi:hypothetical protein NDU88_000640 [Pleurodeles waltl]|uniref:Uncharacterized protein n=1 Tax=Pleurodeles waltl TaxID=8319 RepID=A0AAV7LYP8_PLEWA|nr:hypothetical protein NDU88_000640 [Pleurodeles waltl]